MTEMKKAGGHIAIVGVVTILLGIFSIAAPLVTGIAVTILVGTLILAAGLFQAFHAWQGKSFGAGLGDGLWALLYVLAGALVLAHPLMGLSFLTLLLAFFFFSAGLWKSMVAWRFRPRRGWGLVMASGVASLLLGLMIVLSWPFSGTWAIGTLVGIELIFDGWMLLSTGTALREMAKTAGA